MSAVIRPGLKENAGAKLAAIQRTQLRNTTEAELSPPERALKATIEQIERFITLSVPKRDHLVEVCQSIKRLTELGVFGLMRHESLDDLPKWHHVLAASLEDFLCHVSSLDSHRLRWREMTMKQVAEVCYGMKACLMFQREIEGFFTKDQQSAISQSVRKITQQLLDRVHSGNLLCATYRSCGDMLSLMTWLYYCVDYLSPPEEDHRGPRLAGRLTSGGQASISEVVAGLVGYFDETKAASMDARQLSKLFNGLSHLIANGSLKLDPPEGKAGVDRHRLLTLARAWSATRAWRSSDAGRQACEGSSKSASEVIIASSFADFVRQLIEFDVLEPGSSSAKELLFRAADRIERVLQHRDIPPSKLKSYQRFLAKAVLSSEDDAYIGRLEKLVADRNGTSL